MSQPAFFFDRDGVVNQDPHPDAYILSWAQWKWMPGIVELLQAVKDRGFLPVLVTSQKCVGKGLIGETDLQAIHQRMQERLQADGVEFAAIYAHTGLADCPNPPKPDPGMILRAVEEFQLDLEKSWLIGDADRDLEMGRLAGVAHRIRFVGMKPVGVEADFEVSSLEEAARIFERQVLVGK